MEANRTSKLTDGLQLLVGDSYLDWGIKVLNGGGRLWWDQSIIAWSRHGQLHIFSFSIQHDIWGHEAFSRVILWLRGRYTLRSTSRSWYLTHSAVQSVSTPQSEPLPQQVSFLYCFGGSSGGHGIKGILNFLYLGVSISILFNSFVFGAIYLFPMNNSSVPVRAKSKYDELPRREIEGMIADGQFIIILDSKVLRLDAWIKFHPGGELAIKHMVGRDATDEVNACVHP